MSRCSHSLSTSKWKWSIFAQWRRRMLKMSRYSLSKKVLASQVTTLYNLLHHWSVMLCFLLVVAEFWMRSTTVAGNTRMSLYSTEPIYALETNSQDLALSPKWVADLNAVLKLHFYFYFSSRSIALPSSSQTIMLKSMMLQTPWYGLNLRMSLALCQKPYRTQLLFN